MSCAPKWLAPPLLAWLVLLPAPAWSEPLRFQGIETLKAMRSFDEAAQRLLQARAAMAAIEAGQKPSGAASDWAGVVAAMEAAAQAVKKSDGPAVPEAADPAATWQQVKSCETRTGALGRVDRQLRGLQAEDLRCAETRTFLKERLASAAAAEEARRALLKAMTKNPDEGLVLQYFPWRWAELERPLAVAIVTYAGELRRWAERVDRGQTDLRTRAGTLAGWLADYRGARDCVLTGLWAGLASREGTVSGLAIRLTPAGNGWTGTVTVDGRDQAVRSVALKGNAVVISIGDRMGAITGTLGADDRVLKGTFSSIEGPATFTLKKQ
jgi:hypothetical protein